MPLYDFKCSCGNVDSIVAPMKDAPVGLQCKKCNAIMYRIYKLAGIRNKEYSHPLHSDSLAISPNQIEEHKRLFPNVEIDNEGRPVFHNFREHDDYLKKTGFVKNPQRTRPRGLRIDKTLRNKDKKSAGTVQRDKIPLDKP